jgi:GTPase SAR1 family protein
MTVCNSIAGQEKFRAITNSYYRGAHGVIIVYDITNYKSFDSISRYVCLFICLFSVFQLNIRWLQDVESHSSRDAPPKILLIGNKSVCLDDLISIS